MDFYNKKFKAFLIHTYHKRQPCPYDCFKYSFDHETVNKMAKGYWIANGGVNNMEVYKKYIEANVVPLAKFGAKFLVRGGEGQVKEGAIKSRTIILEFSSYENALACYNSDAYQKAKTIRFPAAEMNLFIVHGYGGPQPTQSMCKP
jgi:uncharacterized protein (DUF1330 family)